ncbi:hypothetical protein F0U59_47185 [Archangium gephyra]|nr:hypothetical protein F0U59_47185 [Archangium gephyra]
MKLSWMSSAAVCSAIILSGCGGEMPEAAGAGAEETALVSVEEASELKEAGASVKLVSGTMPQLLRDSVRLGAAEAAWKEFENTTLRGEVAAMAGEVRLNQEGEFVYDGGFWGLSYDVELAGWCRDGHLRDYATAQRKYDNEKGWCTVRRWSTDDPYDCRIIVHVGARPFEKGTCSWRVYAHAP